MWQLDIVNDLNTVSCDLASFRVCPIEQCPEISKKRMKTQSLAVGNPNEQKI